MEGAVKKLKYEQPFLSADVWQVVLEDTVDPLVVVRVASTCKTLWRRFRSHDVIKRWRDEMRLTDRFVHTIFFGFFDLLKNLVTWIPDDLKSEYWENGLDLAVRYNLCDAAKFLLSDNIMSFCQNRKGWSFMVELISAIVESNQLDMAVCFIENTHPIVAQRFLESSLFQRNVKMIDLLLKMGFDAEHILSKYMSYSGVRKNNDMLHFLLQKLPNVRLDSLELGVGMLHTKMKKALDSAREESSKRRTERNL